MNDLNASTSVATPPEDVYYPGGPCTPMETPIHVLLIVAMIGTLRHHFRQRSDIYVIGNIFLYYEEGHPECRRSPDVMIVKGVDAAKYRRSFKTWEERAVPSVVVEFTSRETAEEDQGPKRELYERLGVREYFLFDPLHEYLEQPLMGYRLINGKYEALPAAEDGGLLSSELGLRLVPEGTDLTLIQFRNGERLPFLPELSQTLEETREKTRQAEQRAGQAEQRAGQAEQRAVQLEEELARLRALLPPNPSDPNSSQE
jgi:Uma2 family endonuclease